jgi:flavodoxin
MQRIVVVYFSRDGHTRRIAREIADACGAELDEITEPGRRKGPWGYARSAFEAVLGLSPDLKPSRHTPGPDDLLVIGTPIWFWNVASPVRSYIEAHRGKFERVAFFCTCSSSGQGKVLHDLRRLCHRRPIAKLALTERQCEQGAHGPALDAFVHELRRGQPKARVGHVAPHG